MILIAISVTVLVVWWATLLKRAEWRAECVEPTLAQRIILRTMKALADKGHLYVDREVMSSEVGSGAYQAFDEMEALSKRGYLHRNGWEFTLTEKGRLYLRNHSEVAYKLERAL